MSETLHDSRECPWCKSTDRAVRLDVPSLGIHCYNDWHMPLCRSCGNSEYTHGFAGGCNRYIPLPSLPSPDKWSEDPVERMAQGLEQCAVVLNHCEGKTGMDELIMRLAAKCATSAAKQGREGVLSAKKS